MAYFALAAGHGASDPGAINGTRKEKDDNLKLSLAVGQELADRGHKVVQYRIADTACPAADCRNWIAKQGADFALSFHRNSLSGTATGVETWSFGDSLSVAISKDLSAAISAVSGLYNRGRKGNGAAWITSVVPCAEPEVGFISNPSDNTKFDTNFEKIVKCICDTLENHFGKGTSFDAADGVIAKGTTANYLNIRKVPVNGAVLTSIPEGKVCDIYSIENGWAKVRYNGYSGYSSADYLEIEYIKKDEPEEEKEASSETPENGSVGEDNSATETIPEKEEIADLPSQASFDEETEDSLDKTVSLFIKLLKKIIEIIVKIWRK